MVAEEPWTVHTFDVIVVGESSGSVCAALAAAEGGANVVLIGDVNYLGGQSSAAGVTTMDEAGAQSELRSSGCYSRFVLEILAYYNDISVSKCYFSGNTICPEPDVVRDIFEQWLARAGVTIMRDIAINAVLQDGNTVLGVEDSKTRVRVMAHVVIDGTEFSDLYPLIAGLAYEAGDAERRCAQSTTWLAIRNWYPNGVPEHLQIPANAIEQLKAHYGDTTVDDWLTEFRRRVANDGLPAFPGWGAWGSLRPRPPWSSDVEHGYRGMADTRPNVIAHPDAPTETRSGINFANDSPITAMGIDNNRQRIDELTLALHKTYAYLWYEYYELGVMNWGIADDLGYETATRLFWDTPNIIPDRIERYLTPIPYTREGRRLIGTESLHWSDITDEKRGSDQFKNSVMIGGYFADAHGCGAQNEEGSGYGMYDVPLGVFIPETIDGFLPGLARAAGVDRIASSSIRMQPPEMLGGEVVGVIAALAVRLNVQPRDVPAEAIRKALLARGAIIDVPKP